MTDSAFTGLSFRSDNLTHRALTGSTSGGLLSVADVTANVRKATGARVGFAGVMALLSLAVLPVQVAAIWFGFIAAWELFIRIWIEDRFVQPAARRSQQAGFNLLAAVHFIGGAGFTSYAVIAWSTGDAIGMVLATAWICASANHVFVYFTPNRLLLTACLGPLAVFALAAPFTVAGFTLPALAASATLAALILSAGMFGLDRRVLMGTLAKHAAARVAAEQANTAKSQFLATMSHELRTPLNAVIGYAELIEEEAERGSIAEDAAKIRASARQLLGVIDVILDLSKLESGAIELEREHAEISAVIEQLREAVMPLATVNRNKISFHETTPLGSADVDHRRLYQCLLQLVSNAAKFTKDGEITVTASRTSECLVFEIADTGIGIAPAQQDRIFDPFVQGDDSSARRFEGTGLGLTLVRRLARLMGGDVICESTPGTGSVFRLWVHAGP